MKTSTSEDNDIWTLLNQTQHVLEQVRQRELEEAGLTPIQAEVLTIVKTARGPVYPSMLSRRLFRQPHSTSGLLVRMEKFGLVQKAKDLDRKNLVRISLTAKGEAAYRKQQQVGARAISESLSGLSQRERDVLGGLLERVKEKGLEELRQRQRLTFE